MSRYLVPEAALFPNFQSDRRGRLLKRCVHHLFGVSAAFLPAIHPKLNFVSPWLLTVALATYFF